MSFNMKRLKLLPLILLSFIGLVLTGCPDKSHQRPVPDYSNMSDSGGTEEDEASASMRDE